tara:strand:+ start:885 stop:1448 length:564 start_codon:yes stop_codon:yes gene_type:complete
MIILLDNYDSFTYNLYQFLSELNQEVLVIRNDKTTSEKIEEKQPTHLVISPGPSNPDNAGISKEAIEYFSNKIPVLGVCLGHQCIANTFGANIIQSKEIMHGKISSISHDEKGIFKNIPNPFNAVRYHSLIIEEKTLSKDFEISARSESGTIQGIRHKSLSLEGVQFHPESIETENGKELLSNFIGL